MARHDARAIRAAGLRTCRRAAGIFRSGALSEARLLDIIEGIGEGDTELVCHPGYEDAILRERYQHWNYHWKSECDALTSAAVQRAIAERGIVLANYRDL